VESAGVRAQVTGVVAEVLFREGQMVREGQELFRLEAGAAEATVRQLEANLARDEAAARAAEAQAKNVETQAANAEAQARRYEDLAAKDFVTREQYENLKTAAEASRSAAAAARASVESAKAAAAATRSALDNARIQLGYYTIRSPMDGLAGEVAAVRGNLVRANDSNALVVVNRMDPIQVRFTIPERVLSDVQRYHREHPLEVEVRADGLAGVKRGRLVFLDNAVDPATGTVVLKAEFKNPTRDLWPGRYVEAFLVLTTRRGVVTVPASAVQTGQTGDYVYLLSPEKTALMRPVKVGSSAEGVAVIDEGVAAGDTVVTDGQLKLVPGASVVVKEAAAEGADKR